VYNPETRKTNGNQHNPLVGLVRWCFQQYRLIETWTEAISPYHSITSIREAGEQDTVENDDNTDTTNLVFIGLCNIRADAWGTEAPPQFEFNGESQFNLIEDEPFLLL